MIAIPRPYRSGPLRSEGMRAWSRRRKVLLGLAVLAAIWAAGSAYLLLSARSDLHAGAIILRRVRARATISAVVDPVNRADLARAEADFRRGSSQLDSAWLDPLEIVPIASRHLAASRQLGHASRAGATAATRALVDIDRLVLRPHSTGPERVSLLHALAAVAARTDQDLARIRVGSSRSLLGSLGRAVDEMAAQRDAARRGAQRMEVVSTALAHVLDGPQPYLLLGANNAEMRDGSGMFLSAATLGFDHGTLHLGEVHPAADIVLPGGRVPVTGQLTANWSWLDPGRDLRNLGLTPDFPQSARVATENWAATSVGTPVAGAIVVDVDGIRALLRAVGPVDVEGIRYTADNVRGELLRKQYYRDANDRAARRDRLGLVARAVFDRLQHGSWKVAELASDLVDAVQERHILVWSAAPAIESAWHDVGADGHVTDRTLAIGLLNRGAAKTDSWVDTAAQLSSTRGADGRIHVTLTYRISNSVPGSGPRYLVGPNVAGLSVGDHRGLVVVSLPAGTTGVTLKGARLFLDGSDGPTRLLGGDLVIRRGQTVTLTITATLRAGLTEVVLEPSARINATVWTIDGRAFPRDRRRTVVLAH